jgi:hypothetical protein
MKKNLLFLLLFLLALLFVASTAGAWNLPVPSGMTAGDQVYAIDGSTLGNRGSLVATCSAETWTAGASPSLAGKSCIIVTIAGSVTITSLLEAGAVAGQLLTIINISNQNLIINESAGVNDQAGNITFAQWDSGTWLYTGTSWVEIGASNN